MKKPNFFIIGAPKCGTTSFAAWLAGHPQVFFSPIKEICFFNFDYGGQRFRSLVQYEKLFENADNRHVAVGEGSTRYLFSRTAVPAILQYTKHPRFIVMIRNPADMVYSLHEQALYDGDETEKDFEKAWELQHTRIYGDNIPRSCNDPQRLFYGQRCKLGDQLDRLFRLVSPEQVLMLNLDHVKQNTRKEYLKVLRFLGLKDDNRRDFPVLNTAKERKFPGLWLFVKSMNEKFKAMGVPYIRTGLTSFICYKTRRERSRPPMKQEMRQRLTEYFKKDIDLLEQITSWDLSSWKSVD